MTKKLTAASAMQVKPGVMRREIADGGCPGLYLVVQPSGLKSWALRFRSPIDRDKTGVRKARKLTLGAFAERDSVGDDSPRVGSLLTLADARALAIDALRRVQKGVDPARDHILEKRAQRSAPSSRVDEVLAEFMAKHLRKRGGGPIRESTRREKGRLLGLVPAAEDLTRWISREPPSGVIARWGGRDVRSIAKRDVLDLLDEIVDAGAPIVANRTLSALKTFFAWCVKRDILLASPCVHVDDPSPETTSERSLSDLEIVACWRAAEGIGYPYGRMVQLLLLTGQRRDEVRALPRTELELGAGVWTIPGDRTKNGREHLVPLTEPAIAILKAMPRIKSAAGWVFTTSGDVPMSNLSKRKRRLNAAMLLELRKIDPEIAHFQPWRLHHLRHTLKTWMQKSRIAKDVRNAVQNHYDGDMDELYGHYSFEKEKREALEGWAAHVADIVARGAVAKVLPFQQA